MEELTHVRSSVNAGRCKKQSKQTYSKKELKKEIQVELDVHVITTNSPCLEMVTVTSMAFLTLLVI